MSNNLSVKAAERKVLRLYQKDGLWDVLMGLFFVMLALGDKFAGFGLPEPYQDFVSLGYLAVGLAAYYLLKNRVVAPRVGVVKISPIRNSQKRRIVLVAFGLFVATWVIFLLSSSGWLQSSLSGRPPWLIDAFFGTAIFGVFALMAYSMDTPRFAFYGFLLGISPVLGVMLDARGEAFNSGPTLLAGAVMALVGIYVFINFLKENPVVEVEVENAKG